MTTRLYRKQLAGEEDLSFGEGTETQTRNGADYTINKVRNIRPVNSIAERDALDPTKHPKVAVVVNDVITFYQYDTGTLAWVEMPIGYTPATGAATDVQTRLREVDTQLFYTDQTTQELTGPGAVDITSKVTHVVTTGADALTLVDGSEGQEKFIVMKTDGGDGTLTPSNLGNGTTITFDDVGDTACLLFTNGAWHFTGGTATLA